MLTFITDVTEGDLLCSVFQTHLIMNFSILFQDYYCQELLFSSLSEKISCFCNVEIGWIEA